MATRTHTTAFALLAVAGFLTLSAAAHAAPALPGCRNPRAIARYLRLTPAQVEQWRPLREALREAVDPLQAEIAPLRDDLEALLDGANPDACSAGGLVVQIDGKHDQIVALRDDYEADFEALLTPEQLTRWERLQAVCHAEDATAGI